MTTSKLPSRPEIDWTQLKWRVDSKPREASDSSSGYIARFVAWLPAERLADMLDAWVGPENWWSVYEPAGKEMWCTISIQTPDGRVVHKVDVGDIGDSSKFGTTDSFKRCATRMWGIGREVRSIPTLWAPCRTYMRDNERVAVPNHETEPTLRRKLADLGHGAIPAATDEAPDDQDPAHESNGPEPAAPPAPPPDAIPDMKWNEDDIRAWIAERGRNVPDADTTRKVDLLRHAHAIAAADGDPIEKTAA
ncbi:MAG: hypothetical protein AAGA37_19940 [Actinomycetota bacterium]